MQHYVLNEAWLWCHGTYINESWETGWEGRKKGFVRDLAHTTKKNFRQKTDIHESKEKDSST